MHLKLHRGEKEPKMNCNDCGKTFSNKYSLKCHLKSHSPIKSIKKYQCKECDNEFETRSDYMIHRQKHLKENQDKNPASSKLLSTGSPTLTFICEVCHQIFSRKSQLLQHLLTHEDETNVNYSCRKCGKNFTIK